MPWVLSWSMNVWSFSPSEKNHFAVHWARQQPAEHRRQQDHDHDRHDDDANPHAPALRGGGGRGLGCLLFLHATTLRSMGILSPL
jgi:hypothetical protein